MNHNFFDKRVRENLDGHEAPVPADAWANIQQARRKRRPLPFFFGLLAGLLLCGLTAVYLLNTAGREKVIPAAAPPQQPAVQPLAAGSATTNRVSAATNTPSSSNKKNTGNTITGTHSPGPYEPAPATAAVSAGRNNNRTTNNNFLHNTTAYPPAVQQPGNPVSSVLNGDEATGGDETITAHPLKKDAAGRLAIQITAAGTTQAATELSDHTANNSSADGPADPIKERRDTIALLALKDSLPGQLQAMQGDPKKPSPKKPGASRWFIDFGLSAFMPGGSRPAVSSVSRTTTRPLQQAVFEAGTVRIRMQPSACLQLLLFKPVSPALSVGAGLSYQQVKEYVYLSGEEVRTNYTLIKRLNGNVLTDDTVTTTTKGTRAIDAVNSYTFFSLPVVARYRLWQGSRWAIGLQAGIDINLQSRYKNSISGELVPQFANAQPAGRSSSIGTGFNAGMHISRLVGRRYFMYAAPYLQLNSKTLYLKEMLAPGKLHRAGVAVGIRYGL